MKLLQFGFSLCSTDMRGLILFGFILTYAVVSGKGWDNGEHKPAISTGTVKIPRHGTTDNVDLGTVDASNPKKDDPKNNTTEKPSSPSEDVPNDADYFQPKPEMSKPPNCPLLPFFIGFDGNSIHTNKQIDVIASIVDISKQIAGNILDPNTITGMKTLSKFTTMTVLIRTMSFDQIKQTSEKIYMKFPENEINKNRKEYIAWSVFRDAVSQAGTGPAFLIMKDWIMNDQVQGEEAAELLSVLPNTARHPTTDYMNNFFDMVTNEKVTSQKYLNVSSVLSFTNLVRKVLVNNETTHNRFPVHAFGSFTTKVGKDIEKYMHYLSDKLSEAVNQGDGVKIQVYIRALGNTAHKDILNIFEPFLEGKKPMSDFQRLTIIASMDKITKTHPKVTRAVLFNVYQNTGEAQEMRVAAVIQLMKTNPPAPILQRMAEFTNQDHNNQVISVVKSAIEEASRLNTIPTRKLANNARSAINLLTTKELGVQYSKNFIRSYIFENDFLGYNSDFSYIQGKDSIIPSSIFYNHMRNMGGLKRQNFQMAFMSSSSDDLFNFVFDHFADYPQKMNQSTKNPDSKWSWENMEKMFKFDMDYAKHVEGNIMFTTLGGRRFFPFDNKTIESIQDDLKKFSYDFKIGKVFNFTKLYDQHEIKLAFPTATGLPFVFSLNVPSLVHIDGEFVGKAHPDFSLGEKNKIFVPRSANASLDITYTYSSKIQGKMGFTAPFNHKVYTTSLDKNMHLHLPLHFDIDLDRQNQIISTKIQPLRPKRDHKLFECSSQAYTSSKNISDLNPWNEKNTNTIHIMKNHNFETTFGQKTGFAFDLKMQGEHKSFDPAKMFLMAKQHNWQSALLYPSYEDSISNHNLTLTFNSKMSTTKLAKIHLSYRNIYNWNETNTKKYNQKNQLFSLHQDRKQRFQDMINRATEGIQSNQVRILDAELSFDDSLKYVATATQSSGSEKTRFMFGINKFSPKSDSEKAYQISFQVDAKMPKVALENYKKALESDPTSSINAWLNYGKDEKSGASISLEGKLRRTENRLDFLKNHQVSKECMKDMKNGNYIQPACRNVTANSNFLDNYEFTIEYNNVPDCCKNMSYKAYSIARQVFYPWVSDRMTKNENDKIDLEVQFSTNLKYVNVSINAPVLSSRMENVNVDQMVIPWVVTHPEYNAWERFSQKIFLTQQFPVCAVDSNMITTFDNKQYPFKIGNCWRLIAHAAPKPRYKLKGTSERYIHPENEQMSLIAREVGSSSREFVLMLGKNVVYVQPANSKDINVQVNGEKTSISNSKIFKDNSGNIYLKISILPTGSMMLEAPQTGMQVIFDGYRIKTQISNGLRNQMRGMCGNFDGEEANEFISPKNCIMKDPIHFVTSYTLNKDCNEDLKDIYRQIEKMSCTKEIILFSDAVNNEHNEEPALVNVVAPKGTKDNSCTNHQVKIIEKSGQTCFSSRPQMICSSHCLPVSEVEKDVDFYCVSNNQLAMKWVEMVKKGGNPDFSQKGSPTREAIKLPESCKRL